MFVIFTTLALRQLYDCLDTVEVALNNMGNILRWHTSYATTVYMIFAMCRMFYDGVMGWTAPA